MGRLSLLLRQGSGQLLSSARQLLLSALPIALFGGHRQGNRADLLVAILAGILTVVVWALGLIYLAYRLFVVADGRSRGPRWAIGVPALVAWTCAVVLVAQWIVD